MNGWMGRIVVTLLLGWGALAYAGAALGAEKEKTSVPEEVLKKMAQTSSADLLRNTEFSPDEDFEAGKFAYGRGDLVEAQGLFERAAGKGHIQSMMWIAEILLKTDFIAEAAAWYRKAVALGSAEAQFGLAKMMLDHYSYAVGNAELNYKEARELLGAAAEQGHQQAALMLANAYITGGLGLKEDDRTDEEILHWVTRAADLGDVGAMRLMTSAFRTGKYGLPVDEAKAKEWEAKIDSVIKKEDRKEPEKKRRRG